MASNIAGPIRTGNNLLDVIDTILDKGLVIDIYIDIQLVGISLITIQARIVVASVDTYLRYARAVMELNEEFGREIPLAGERKGTTLTELPGELAKGLSSGGAEGKVKGAAKGVKEAIKS